jgi:hypothetical protein
MAESPASVESMPMAAACFRVMRYLLWTMPAERRQGEDKERGVSGLVRHKTQQITV